MKTITSSLGLAGFNTTKPTPFPTAVAPTVTVATRSRPVGHLHVHRPRPSDHPDAEQRQKAGALIECMASAAFLLDYAVRQISYMGVAKREAKQQLSLTINQIEKLTGALMSQFGSEGVDYFNAESSRLQDCAALFCRLDEGQKDAALEHMKGMAKANIAFVPALTPYNQQS